MKVCFKCGKTKALNEFYRHPRMADGRLGKCKTCTKKDVAQNYQDKRVYYAHYEKLRYKKPERRKAIKEYQRTRRAKSPGKYRCAYTVSNAIRNGTLVRQPCEQCGKPNAQAHHEDYRRPFKIRWLCRKHHLTQHSKKAY